MAISYAIVYSV